MEAEPDLQSHKLKEKKRKLNRLDASVQMVKKDPEKNAPVLGYSSSGFDPLNHKSSKSNDLRFYRHRTKDKRVEFVIKPTGFKVDYVGTSYSGEAAVGGMGGCNLAVVHKKSQLVQFVPVTANKTFRLLPLARASQISHEEPDTPAKIDTKEEKKQSMNKLTHLYGTKAAKKKDNKIQQRIDQDSGAVDEMDQIIEETKIDNTALASSSLDTPRNVPPHDLSATVPEKAYLLDQIIQKGEWNYVDDILKLVHAGQEIQPNVYPSFVCNRFYKVELCQDEAEKGKLAGILSFISHLINFKNRNSLGGFSSSKDTKPLPKILLLRFNKMFVDFEKKRLSDEKLGSLINQVLVLTLFVDEFETDFTDIAKDLKMSALKLRPYFENLGCQFKRRNNVTVATLPVPLKFPTIRRKRRRG